MTPLFPDVFVNGKKIPSAAIAAEAQNHNAPSDKPGLAWRAAARALVIRDLLLQQAEPEATPKQVGKDLRETDEDARIRELLDRVIEPDQVSAADIRRVFDQRRGDFRAPDLYEASHILIGVQSGQAKDSAAAMAQARLLAEKIADDPKGFAGLAKAHSDCESGASGGMLGQISTGDVAPEFEAALAGLEPGEVTETPVASRFGYHIIRLDAKAEGKELPFEAVRERIQQGLEKRAWARAANVFVTTLVANADIQGIDLTSG